MNITIKVYIANKNFANILHFYKHFKNAINMYILMFLIQIYRKLYLIYNVYLL